MGLYWCFQDYMIIGVYEKLSDLEKALLTQLYTYFTSLQKISITYNDFENENKEKVKIFMEEGTMNIGEATFTIFYSNSNFPLIDKTNNEIRIPLNQPYDYKDLYEKKKPSKKITRSPISKRKQEKNEDDGIVIEKEKKDEITSLSNEIKKIDIGEKTKRKSSKRTLIIGKEKFEFIKILGETTNYDITKINKNNRIIPSFVDVKKDLQKEIPLLNF